MPKVFLSHAAADKKLADDVKTMLQGAVGLQPRTELFYSSGSGTGVPGGRNFVEYIRSQMTDETLVIAIITPAFLQSAFCLAELGAVWLTADDESFFPLCVPAIDRNELRATLTGIQVELLDQRPALADMLHRVSEHFGRTYNAAAADEQITAFTSTLPTRLKDLATPATVPSEKLDEANTTIATLGEQLALARDQISSANARVEEVLEAKTLAEAEERARAVDGDTTEELKGLLAAARSAVKRLPSTVADALPFELRGVDMPRPDFGSYEHADVQAQVDEGRLRDTDDGVAADPSFPDVEAAIAAVSELQAFLGRLTPDEEDWFKSKYEVPADLRKGAVFRTLLR